MHRCEYRESCPYAKVIRVKALLPDKLCGPEWGGIITECRWRQLMDCGHPRLYEASMDGDASVGMPDIRFCAKCREERR